MNSITDNLFILLIVLVILIIFFVSLHNLEKQSRKKPIPHITGDEPFEGQVTSVPEKTIRDLQNLGEPHPLYSLVLKNSITNLVMGVKIKIPKGEVILENVEKSQIKFPVKVRSHGSGIHTFANESDCEIIPQPTTRIVMKPLNSSEGEE